MVHAVVAELAAVVVGCVADRCLVVVAVPNRLAEKIAAYYQGSAPGLQDSEHRHKWCNGLAHSDLATFWF